MFLLIKGVSLRLVITGSGRSPPSLGPGVVSSVDGGSAAWGLGGPVPRGPLRGAVDPRTGARRPRRRPGETPGPAPEPQGKGWLGEKCCQVRVGTPYPRGGPGTLESLQSVRLALGSCQSEGASLSPCAPVVREGTSLLPCASPCTPLSSPAATPVPGPSLNTCSRTLVWALSLRRPRTPAQPALFPTPADAVFSVGPPASRARVRGPSQPPQPPGFSPGYTLTTVHCSCLRLSPLLE